VPVDLRHFRSFVVVAEEGHIGRAARRLFITQPALSRQIQQLEREIDAPVLARTAHGVELTEAGSPGGASAGSASCRRTCSATRPSRSGRRRP
jgi:hypothetical protein